MQCTHAVFPASFSIENCQWAHGLPVLCAFHVGEPRNVAHVRRQPLWEGRELDLKSNFSYLCEWKRKERGWKDWKVWKRKRDSKYHLSPTSELGSSSKVGTAVQSPVSFKVEQRWPQVEFCRALVKVVADVVQSRFVFQYENVEVSLNWNDTSFSYFSDTHLSEKLKAFIGV